MFNYCAVVREFGHSMPRNRDKPVNLGGRFVCLGVKLSKRHSGLRITEAELN
jgi:hypothetical protein